MPYKPKTISQLTHRPVVDDRPSPSLRGYSKRWQSVRHNYLSHHPLCVVCMKQGITTPASVVDHIIPHKGEYGLMWSESNYQSLCQLHHNQKTGREQSNKPIYYAN